MPLVVCSIVLLLTLAGCGPGGGSWQAAGLHDHSIRTLAVDPNNVNKIYAGDTNGTVIESSDGGVHWGVTGSIAQGSGIDVLAFSDDGRKLYAGAEQGLFISGDGGQHWKKASSDGGQQAEGGKELPVDRYTALTFDINAPKDVYIGTAHQGVFVSTDGGVTWKAGSGGLPQGVMVKDLVYDAASQQLWAATSQGVYLSDNQGVAWSALNNGLPAEVGVNVILPAFVDGGTRGLIYAGTERGFFRSQDNGLHWTRGRDTLVGTTVNALLIDFHNSNTNTLYAATGVGALRSDDSGITWGGVAAGLPKGQAVYNLAQGADSYGQIYAAVNDVYLYPGNSGGLSPARWLPLLLIFGFMYGLVGFLRRGRRNTRGRLLTPRTNNLSASPQDSTPPTDATS